MLANALSDALVLEKTVLKEDEEALATTVGSKPSAGSRSSRPDAASDGVSAQDALLIQALVSRVEGLIPVCNARQLARVSWLG